MRESRSYGSVRGARGDPRPYRDPLMATGPSGGWFARLLRPLTRRDPCVTRHRQLKDYGLLYRFDPAGSAARPIPGGPEPVGALAGSGLPEVARRT
jgi:hypothetical protein